VKGLLRILEGRERLVISLTVVYVILCNVGKV